MMNNSITQIGSSTVPYPNLMSAEMQQSEAYATSLETTVCNLASVASSIMELNASSTQNIPSIEYKSSERKRLFDSTTIESFSKDVPLNVKKARDASHNRFDEELNKLKEAVIDRNSKKFQQIFSEFEVDAASELAQLLLEKQYKTARIIPYEDGEELQIEEELETEEDFQTEDYPYILDQLFRAFPQVKYCFDKPHNGVGVNKISLTTTGMRVVLDDLEDKDSLQDLDCIVCDCVNPSTHENPYDEYAKGIFFTKKVLEIMKEMNDELGHQRCCFLINLINHGFKSLLGNDHYGHIVAFYLEKTENGLFRVLTLDSLGLEEAKQNEKFAWVIQQNFHNTLSKYAPELLAKTSQYLYAGKKRQKKDPTNCSIFSIRDAVQFAKHGKEIMDWATTQKAEWSCGAYHIKSLPEMMMRTYQSLSAIQEFDQTITDVRLHVKKSPSHLIVNSKGKKFNSKISDTFLKYEAIIFNRVILWGVRKFSSNPSYITSMLGLRSCR